MRTIETTGKVYLIGAGPGDPKLLTVKASEVLGRCDVIVYDYLVNPEVLVYSRRGAELIYVGKRAGEPSSTQDEINRILIERARRGEIVARLKGGDPFIFGRGGEEAEALVEANIPWEVVPGVSAGIAGAAYAGIPLTHRDYSSSVAFITGHTRRNRTEGIDWSRAAHAAETLVVFMCAETIAGIARQLIQHGRELRTPIAIIRWATYEHQEIYSGTLEEVAALDAVSGVCSAQIAPPAIAVVGDVVNLKDKLHWFGLPAFGIADAEPVET